MKHRWAGYMGVGAMMWMLCAGCAFDGRASLGASVMGIDMSVTATSTDYVADSDATPTGDIDIAVAAKVTIPGIDTVVGWLGSLLGLQSDGDGG